MTDRPERLPTWVEGQRYLEAADELPQGGVVFDGITVPLWAAARLRELRPELRLPTFGLVLAVGEHTFGPPAGVCPVVVCEKIVLVFNVAYQPPDDVQGVHRAIAADI